MVDLNNQPFIVTFIANSGAKVQYLRLALFLRLKASIGITIWVPNNPQAAKLGIDYDRVPQLRTTHINWRPCNRTGKL